ncbi:MAG: NTP transferase domain-containing protein [Planctomycetes bacterium]|nr:NTP transferase domain-containing protein [Planctomycetota bacterium]
MHAVILAGGKGSRLAPLTVRTPKVLLPIDGTAVIERLIGQLREEEILEITVVTGHLSEMVQQQLGNGDRLGVRIQYVCEPRLLDTAGCLGQLRPTATFLLINGDVVTDFRFSDLVRSHEEAACLASVAVRRHCLPVDFGVIQCDEGGRMSAFVEKPTYECWVNMGIYCFEPSVCRLVAAGERLSMPDLLLRLRSTHQEVNCHKTECYWRDIGRPQDYLQAQQDLATATPRLILRHAA